MWIFTNGYRYIPLATSRVIPLRKWLVTGELWLLPIYTWDTPLGGGLLSGMILQVMTCWMHLRQSLQKHKTTHPEFAWPDVWFISMKIKQFCWLSLLRRPVLQWLSWTTKLSLLQWLHEFSHGKTQWFPSCSIIFHRFSIVFPWKKPLLSHDFWDFPRPLRCCCSCTSWCAAHLWLRRPRAWLPWWTHGSLTDGPLEKAGWFSSWPINGL